MDDRDDTTTEVEVRVPWWALAGLVILGVARVLTWRRRGK